MVVLWYLYPSMVFHDYSPTKAEATVFKACDLPRALINGLHYHYVCMRKAHPEAEEWSRPCLRMYLELEDEPFHNLFYTLIDTSGEGWIGFEEWVLSLCAFLGALELDDLIDFSMRLFDWSKEGTIAIPDFEKVLSQVFGEDWEEVEGSRQVHASFCEFAGKAGKPVDRDLLRVYLRGAPSLLFPSFELQKHIQRKIFGIGFWTSYARQRGAAKDRREAATKKKAKKEGTAATPLKSHVYEPSELHSALLNYKSKCVSAMITNTGDDNSALRNAFTRRAQDDAKALMAGVVGKFKQNKVLDPTFRNHLGELDEKLKGVDPKFHVPRQQYEGLLMEATRALHARTTRVTGGCKGYCDRLCCHLVKRRLEEARDVTREVITTSVRTISPRRNVHPLESLMLDSRVCEAADAQRYISLLAQRGYDSLWALKSVRPAEELARLGIDKKLHRVRLFQVVQEAGDDTLPQANLPIVEYVRRLLSVEDNVAEAYTKPLRDMGADVAETFLLYADVEEDLSTLPLLPGHKVALKVACKAYRRRLATQGSEQNAQLAVTAVPLPSETVMMQPSLALSSAFALAPDSRVEPGMVFDDQPMRLQSGAAAARPSNAEAPGQADARAAVGVPRRRPSCQTSRAALSTQSSVVTRHSDGSGERKSGVTFALPQTMANTADAQEGTFTRYAEGMLDPADPQLPSRGFDGTEESEPVGKGTFTMYAEELLGQADTRIPATTRNVDGEWGETQMADVQEAPRPPPYPNTNTRQSIAYTQATDASQASRRDSAQARVSYTGQSTGVARRPQTAPAMMQDRRQVEPRLPSSAATTAGASDTLEWGRQGNPSNTQRGSKSTNRHPTSTAWVDAMFVSLSSDSHSGSGSGGATEAISERPTFSESRMSGLSDTQRQRHSQSQRKSQRRSQRLTGTGGEGEGRRGEKSKFHHRHKHHKPTCRHYKGKEGQARMGRSKRSNKVAVVNEPGMEDTGDDGTMDEEDEEDEEICWERVLSHEVDAEVLRFRGEAGERGWGEE